MKNLFAIGLLGLFLIGIPPRHANMQDCENVLVYSKQTGDGIRYYQLNVNEQLEVEIPIDNLISTWEWSPNGEDIAIITNIPDEGINLAIYLSFDDDSIPLVSEQGQIRLRWSPDGNLLAFEDYYEAYGKIQIITRTGESYQQFEKNDQVIRLGDWSPDGQYLTVEVESLHERHIAIVNLETGIMQDILLPVQGVFDSFVSWTPDSSGILYTTNRFSDNSSLYLLNLNDKTSELYIDSPVTSISWNPTSSDFVYAILNRGFNEVHTRNLLTGEDFLLTEVTPILHESYIRPVWSPSGSFIAFSAIDTSNRGAAYEIFTISLETNEIVQLTSNNQNDSQPQWVDCQF